MADIATVPYFLDGSYVQVFPEKIADQKLILAFPAKLRQLLDYLAD